MYIYIHIYICTLHIYTQYNTVQCNQIQCNNIRTKYKHNTIQYLAHVDGSFHRSWIRGLTKVSGFSRRAPQALAASRGGGSSPARVLKSPYLLVLPSGYWKWPIYLLKLVIFHSYIYIYKRLPEGIHVFIHHTNHGKTGGKIHFDNQWDFVITGIIKTYTAYRHTHISPIGLDRKILR